MRGKKEVRVLTVVALLIVLAWNSFNSEDSENISLQPKVDAHIENVENEAEEVADTKYGLYLTMRENFS